MAVKNNGSLSEEEILRAKKRQVKISLSRAAATSYLNSVMPQTGLTYNISTTEKGVVLKVKLERRRMIQVKMNYLNYVDTMKEMLPAIKVLKADIENMGRLNIRLTCYSTVRWTEPGTEACEEE